MTSSAKYLLRLDDACPTMDWAKWKQCEALFDQFDIRPMIGVIPDNQDTAFHIDPEEPKFWDQVREWQLEKKWTIGLHGYQHIYSTTEGGLVPINQKSEFAGIPFEEQVVKIRQGWEIMTQNGATPTVWIAPGHSFDSNTLKALQKETSIQVVSDGIALSPYFEQNFYWIPQQIWRYRDMQSGVFTICLHPNTMSDKEFTQLKRDLTTHHKKFISFEQVALSEKKRTLVDRAASVAFFARLKLKRLLT